MVIAGRYLVVLPVLLLAAASLTGTVVRRLARTDSRRAYVFGVLACLFLAPIPLVPGPFFSLWAIGLIFGITSMVWRLSRFFSPSTGSQCWAGGLRAGRLPLSRAVPS